MLRLARELKRSERLPRKELERRRDRRLQRLVRHAGERVPYYRELFGEMSIRPEDIQGPADLAVLPVLTRETVSERFADLVVEGRQPRFSQLLHTSGSTGEPLDFLCDPWDMSHHLANQIRGRSWHDLGVGASELRICIDPREYAATSFATRALWTASALKERLLNVQLVGATDLSEESLERWAVALRRQRPALVYGYAASVYAFARFLRDDGGHVPSPRAVMITAEKILPAQKALITAVFRAGVFEEYGAKECGVLAFECPHSSLHTSDETAVLEVPRADASGAGELVMTSLSSYAMPLIRYGIGDVAGLSDEPCACGLTLGVMDPLVGRSTDSLVAADGGRVHPFELLAVVQQFDSIARYRIVQESPRQVELVVELRDSLEPRQVATITAAFRRALGTGTELAIRRVDSIPQSPSGKHKFLVGMPHDR